MSAKDKDVVRKGAQEPVAFSYAGDVEGQGFEQQTRDDLTVPFLILLQAMSPQCEERPGSNPLARPGRFFNTVTEQVTESVEFLPVLTEHLFTEWVPREEGGGFRGAHRPESPEVTKAREESREFGVYKLGKNDLVETFQVWALDVKTGEGFVLPFTSTKIKAYKRWSARLNMFTLQQADGRKVRPPLFAHRTRILSTADENKHGKFYNVAMTPVNATLGESLVDPASSLFSTARDLYATIKSGVLSADYAGQEKAGDAGGDKAMDGF